nr:hypothetical protein [Enterococcus innesii]
MAEKKIGLLNKQNTLERKEGNIVPKRSFNDSSTESLEHPYRK